MSDDHLKPKRRYLAKRRGPFETALASAHLAPDAEADEIGELAGQLADAQAQAKEGEPRQLDPNLGLTIRVSLQDKAKVLIDEAKDPNSDAAKIVYAWVLNALATAEEQLSPGAIKILSEERARHILLKTVVVQRGQIIGQGLDLRNARVRLDQDALHMNRARDLATTTQRSLEKGEPVDMRLVCRQIAEMVGLAPPPQFNAGGQLNWEAAGGTSNAGR